MEIAILMDHIFGITMSTQILILNVYHVFYLVKQVLVSGLELLILLILLLVAVIVMMILFAVLHQVMILLLSVFGFLKDYQKFKKDFTSVVYQLIVLLLLTISLLIYSVRKYNGLIN